jgi:hypothetical protein
MLDMIHYKNSLLQNFNGNYYVQKNLPGNCSSNVARTDSLTTHNSLEPSLKISGALPSFNLSHSIAHIGTTVLYLYFLPMYISLKRPHPFQSYKGTFYTLLSPYIHTT